MVVVQLFPTLATLKHNAMTVLERKAELIKTILNDVDDDVLKELEAILYYGLSNREPSPCQYSVEELRKRAKQAIEEVETGQVTPHEEVKKRFAV